MVKQYVEKVFGTRSDRVIKKLRPAITRINQLEPQFAALSDDDLRAQTAVFQEKLENGASLDSILAPAFAVVREAGKRVLDMRHYDVQLAGGMVLHEGKIAEMRTGEGKTLVATLPVYLNALSGRGAHLVTVNDYLARRDAEWMGKLYGWLGLSTGIITADISDETRRAAYHADITYGTNNEFGFDYLRDNMKFAHDEMVQRPLAYGIVDEVDSILIDEARTPLIISGPAELSEEIYHKADRLIPKLRRDVEYVVEERSRSVTLTERGVHRVEELLGVNNLYDMQHIEMVHHMNQALRAHAVYRRDVDYVVTGGEVVIVDEFTGRLMDGRRWSDGLHQAVEAKEGVRIQRENHTLATITFQNYFRMYEKLSGMTGTAETEREEFMSVYGMDVVVVPTNKPIARIDEPDLIFLSERAKFEAICDDIEKRQNKGQPVLVGTASVERSEVLSRFLARRKVEHTVLNAKHHAKESQIVAQAGRLGAVTIATNMAGRGTDILLGGNPEFLARERVIRARNQEVAGETFKWMSGRPELIDPQAVAEEDYPAEQDQALHDQAAKFVEGLIAEYAVELEKAESEMAGEKDKVLAAGGMHILGSERHESRRIDNQLRGRSGRQGDPGSSQFFLSLEDDLMRRFAGEKLQGMMERWGGMKEDDVIDSRLVSRQIEGAQKRVEAYNFGIRKNVLEMDNVMNQQRATLYGLRREILAGENFDKRVRDSVESTVIDTVGRFCPVMQPSSDWSLEALEGECFKVFDVPLSLSGLRRGDVPDRAAYQMELGNYIYSAIARQHEKRRAEFSGATYDDLAQTFYLRSIDHHWKAHLTQMDHLKEGIYLRGYGQKDPRHEYRREGFTLFTAMLDRVSRDALMQLFRVDLVDEEAVAREEAERRARARRLIEEQRRAAQAGEQRSSRRARKAATYTGRVAGGAEEGTVRRDRPKIGRNDPCWCGSGKKYKHCHGRPGAESAEI